MTPRPDVTAWRFTVLVSFRLGGRTYGPGDVLNRRRLAIGPRKIRKLLDTGKVEVETPE
jgi:hypothetical protein